MPNWCYNHLEITGPKGVLADFQNATSNDEGDLSFSCLVPMPEEKLNGDGWYDWAVNNWGAKWDIDGRETTCEHTPLENGSALLSYDFNTAWAPPSAWLARVAPQYPQLKFQLWFDEPGCDFAGLDTFENGQPDPAATWEGGAMGILKCAVADCDEYVDGKAVYDFTSEPTPADLEVFCEDHSLVKAVVETLRADGETVTVLPAKG